MRFSVIQNGPNRTSKMAAGGHFEKKVKNKIVYSSEMARNAFESDFRSSKMAAGSHFVKKKNQSCVLIWNGEKCDRKRFSVIQNGRRQPFCEKKIKIAYWSKMSRNAIKSDFRSSKMAAGSHFVKKKSCVLIWNGEKCDRKWFSVFQTGGGGGASQWPACIPFGIYTVFALGQIHQF